MLGGLHENGSRADGRLGFAGFDDLRFWRERSRSELSELIMMKAEDAEIFEVIGTALSEWTDVVDLEPISGAAALLVGGSFALALTLRPNGSLESQGKVGSLAFGQLWDYRRSGGGLRNKPFLLFKRL